MQRLRVRRSQRRERSTNHSCISDNACRCKVILAQILRSVVFMWLSGESWLTLWVAKHRPVSTVQADRAAFLQFIPFVLYPRPVTVVSTEPTESRDDRNSGCSWRLQCNIPNPPLQRSGPGSHRPANSLHHRGHSTSKCSCYIRCGPKLLWRLKSTTVSDLWLAPSAIPAFRSHTPKPQRSAELLSSQYIFRRPHHDGACSP